MKTFFYILTLFIISIVPSIQTVSAELKNCETLSWYEKYTCQSTNHCKKYKPEKVSYRVEKFETPDTLKVGENIFEKAQFRYRENQNWIYACSIMMIQQNTLNLIKQKLIKIDKTWSTSSKMQRKIELQLNKLKNLWKNKNCKNINKKSIYAKKEVLTESMYQFCQYRFYLEYMKDYYADINNVLEKSPSELEVQTYWITYIAREHARKQQEILEESDHAQLVFNLAFESYIWYESNLWIHILLELIKEDLIVYREKLHKAISPISQVVYKINNAMSIH